MTDEKGIVEAALFSAGRPVTVEELAQSTGVDPGKVREHLKALASDYTGRSSAVEVAPVGGKWTMQIRMEYTERARAFAPPEIERDLLKTASLVAYHQPLLQSDLGDMIGSKVYEHVHALADLNLINKKPSGRSFELTTTRYFVEFFGLKTSDREGIRRLLAEKAGVKFTPKPSPEPEDAPTAASEPAKGSTQGPPSTTPEAPGAPITGE
jgi:segregation and condensation protein B